MKSIDVTRKVDFDWPVGDNLFVTKCACGTYFERGDLIVGIHKDTPAACPVCNRRFYFNGNVRVYEVRL